MGFQVAGGREKIAILHLKIRHFHPRLPIRSCAFVEPYSTKSQFNQPLLHHHHIFNLLNSLVLQP